MLRVHKTPERPMKAHAEVTVLTASAEQRWRSSAGNGMRDFDCHREERATNEWQAVGVKKIEKKEDSDFTKETSVIKPEV